jgi:hypothetical protein
MTAEPIAPDAMTAAEADTLLASVGLRDDMTAEEISAAVTALPADMINAVGAAIRVSADAIAEEVAALEALVYYFEGDEADER